MQNIVFDNVIVIGLAAAILIAAYLCYLILIFLFRRVFSKESLGGIILVHLSIPILFLFLEIGGFIALQILKLPDPIHLPLEHALIVFFIATVGWAIIAFARALETYLKNKKEKEPVLESERQSFVTKTHIFYRVLVFLVVIFTFASILMTFPLIRNFGIGILGTAGIAGIAIGIAAKPLLENILAGFQIAFTKVLKIGDTVVVEGENGTIEDISLTHVVLRTFDLRRIIFPISHFIENHFQNWSRESREITGIVFMFCDYEAPIQIIREKFFAILSETPLWNQKVASADVTNTGAQGIELRFTMSANNSGDAFNLGCLVREKMVAFLKINHPEALPKVRYL